MGVNSAEITLRSVSLSFPLLHGAGRSLKKLAMEAAGRRLGLGRNGAPAVHALRAINLHAVHGARLGLIGANGAGKSTLLRILAGIYEPDRGSVAVRGAVGALLDPGLGMHGDLTGRENIFLRGLYHGRSGAALRRLVDDVVDFAELDEFLDLPLRGYSAGMAVRLGFALATAIRPRILLMDEWFLAGDAAFQAKAQGRLEDMVHAAEILVVATHQPEILLRWCTRAVWLDEGTIQADGPAADVLGAYLAAR